MIFTHQNSGRIHFENHICPIHDDVHESLGAGYTRGLPTGGSQVSWYFTREFKIDVKTIMRRCRLPCMEDVLGVWHENKWQEQKTSYLLQ